MDNNHSSIISNQLKKANNHLTMSSTTVENPPQIAHTFMQNKPNFPDEQIYLTAFYTKEYENRPTSTLDGNKANTKPNKPNFPKAQMNATFFTTNAYGNEPRTTNNEHSCKTNPIKANSRPVLSHQVCKTARIHWRRRESNPHFRDATAACSRNTTSPISSTVALLYRPFSRLQNRF